MVDLVNNHTYPKSNADFNVLEERLKEVKDEQGVLGSIWNGIKEATNLGLSQSDCENKLEEYQNGEISFDEALEYINDYDKKQKDAKNLTSNILTGVGAIGATIATGGANCAIGLGAALATGAPVGAVLKTGINFFDRATNNIEGDALDVKEIAKDIISGATTGTTSAITSGVGAGIKAGKIGLSVANGVKCGAACGAASGAIGYTTDVVFDDKEFKFGDLTKSTLTSSLVSGTVGAAVGAGMYGIAGLQGNIGENITKTTAQAIISDSASSSARKVLGQAERNFFAA